LLQRRWTKNLCLGKFNFRLVLSQSLNIANIFVILLIPYDCFKVFDLVILHSPVSNTFWAFFSLTSNAVTIVVITLSGVVPGIINNIDPFKLDDYPNYLWIYLHHHITAEAGILANVLIYYIKRGSLINYFKRECLDMLENVGPLKNVIYVIAGYMMDDEKNDN
jgi:hypothetical protein